jgi:hypothetical protein
MVGEVDNRIVLNPLPDTWNNRKPLDPLLVTIAGNL